jgi:hypothetical protein
MVAAPFVLIDRGSDGGESAKFDEVFRVEEDKGQAMGTERE